MLAALLAALATLPASADLVQDRTAFLAQRRSEAAAALARGEWRTALERYQEVLVLTPGDLQVQRETGRAAQAAGEFADAARVLSTIHDQVPHHQDPELHYLRGEALFALGRTDEAVAEHRRVEQEMGPLPHGRMATLWLARVHARRGELGTADALYGSLWPRTAGQVDEEVAFNHAEAHTLALDWAGAERVLRRLLAVQPHHVRAREMLAWVLEVRGDTAAELVVRRSLAQDLGTPAALRDYGRVLERQGELRAALAQYQRAQARQQGAADPFLEHAVERLRYRFSPEASVGFRVRGDRWSKELHLQGGAAVPLGSFHHLSLLAWHARSDGLWPRSVGTLTGLQGALRLGTPGGAAVVLGGNVRAVDVPGARPGWHGWGQAGTQVGWLAGGELPLGTFLHLDVRGELNNAWTDAPITTRLGGSASGVLGQAYLFPLPTRRLVIVVGGQARVLTLPSQTRAALAAQGLLFTGADLVLWRDDRTLAGDVLDELLQRPAFLADAAVLSLRHYEQASWAEPRFRARLALAPRSAPTVASVVLRKTLWGHAGVETRASVGQEPLQQHFLYSGGTSWVLAVLPALRLAASYDLGTETTPGFTGQLHTGWVTLHADL